MKNASLILSAVLMTAMMVSFSGGGSEQSLVTNNSSTYKEVIIGNQVWMTENLNVDKFRNGDTIPEVKTVEDWNKAGKNKQPAWCYYNDDPANGEKYGKLYNWYAVNDPRGLAPKGWHIPSDIEWNMLIDFLGGKAVAGTKMKNTGGWVDDKGKSGNGTNESGFSGLPGGFRYTSGIFDYIGKYGMWWSSTESVTTYGGRIRYLIYYIDNPAEAGSTN